MKSGVSLQQMLTEVKRQSESKEDYLIAPNRLRMESYGKEMFLHLSDDSGTELIEPMTITGIAHRQIGTHLRIPAAYYDRMREERPDLLAYNANTWFKQESSQRMLRTLDGSARAYLSNRYRRIDNIDIAGVTLPILGGLPDIRFESCQITESRMYIKAVNPRLQAEVSPGDIVQAGVIISNSEVGLGSVSIQPLIYRLVCSNGMVVNEAAARRNHVGRVTDSEENFSVYSQATLDAEDKAFVMKIQDAVRAAVEEARFAQVVGKMQEAKAAQMDTHDVPTIVKLGVGIHVLHKDRVCHLAGCLDLSLQQAGTAAHKNHTPRAQVKLALAQCAQHIVDELLRLIFHQRGDFFPVTAPLPLQENGIHIGFLQQNVQIGAGFRADAVIQQNHAIFQRVTSRQVGTAILQQQIIRRETAHIQNQCARHCCQLAQHHGRRCKRLRIALHIADQDAVQLVTVGEVDRFLAFEVTHERLVLCAKVCGWQADGKVNGHQPGGISALCFDFLRDGK